LSLRFAKEVFDANEEFIAFVDGIEAELLDESYGEQNVISIDFEAETKEIIITGDHIIPEFSPVPTFVAALGAVSALIIVSRLGRLRV
jgi:hypothetical protein